MNEHQCDASEKTKILTQYFAFNMQQEKFCIKWNDFQENISSSFRLLRRDGDFADVTVACEDGKTFEAHRIILSSSSPFFQNILRKNQHPHPLVFMRGLTSKELEGLLDFCYFGEASILQNKLDSFMVLAEELQIIGLANHNDHNLKKTSVVGEDETYPPQNIVVVGLPDIELSSQIENFEKHKQYSNIETLSPPKMKSPLQEDDASIPMTKLKMPKLEEVTEDQKLALKSESDMFASTDLDELNRMIESMISKTENMYFGSNGSKGHKSMGRKRAWKCNICGKEGPKNHITGHVEAKHIPGVSHQCGACGKSVKSRPALNQHKLIQHRK